MEWYEIAIDVLKGLAVVVPLVIALVKYVRKAVREKNWSALLNLVMGLMAQAEDMFEHGSDKKAWVLACVESSAEFINYDIDIKQVDTLIDALCDMSRVVNPPADKIEE